MFDVGGGELMLILLAILLLFGPKKIPEFAQMVGKGLRQFRKAQEDLTQQIRDISAEVAVTDNKPYDSQTYTPSAPKPPAIAPVSTARTTTANTLTDTDTADDSLDTHNPSHTSTDQNNS